MNDRNKRCVTRKARRKMKESGEDSKLKLDDCNVAMEMHKYTGKTHTNRD